MSIYIVWLDRDHAKIFEISQEKMERKTIQATEAGPSFFSELVSHLSEAAQVLILGPGVAKHHFQTYLIEHFPALAKRVAGCETVEQPTDLQIAVYAKRLFSSAF